MRVPRIAVLACVLSAAGGAVADSPRRLGGFDVTELAHGVTLFTATSPGAKATNSLVVERKDGLLVVDAQPTVEGGRALVAAIAKVSKQPIRYLVLTHPHADAAGGAAAFPAGTLVVATPAARDRLADPAYDFAGEMRLRAPEAETPARPSPVLLSDGPVTLDDPDRRVVVYPLPRAQCEGNLWVEIPQAGVLAVGDLVVADRNPYAADASINQWIALLNDLARAEGTRIVPLAGPPVDVAVVRQMRDAFAWTRGRIGKGFIDLDPPDQIVERALADPKAATWFDLEARPSFVRTVFDRVYEETVEERRKRGITTPPPR
jgi:glyoxylase-like metal-dependent hydrolase (beta-lactamase superfamily II)